ncbi:MAG: TrmH family RNA methyltransferase [Candidatus Woesearchaeota archaeon]
MPESIKVYSENNDFQHLEVLKKNRVKRTQFGEFFVEGVKPIELLIKNRWNILAFAYAPEKLSDWAKNILQNSTAKKHFELPLTLMEKLSDKEDFSELIAIVEIPKDDLSRIKIKDKLLLVVFDRASSPGNLGTIIRSCDSLGVDGLIVTGHSTDIYDSKTIHASVGTVFSLPVIRLSSDKEVLIYIKDLEKTIGQIQIVGTSAKAQKEIHSHDFRVPTVLLIGNETHGLSSNYKSMSVVLVNIPMDGSASSLNVANAASIILYEIQRQRKNK